MIDFHTHIFPPNFPNYNKIFNCDKYIYIEEKDNEISLMYKNKLFRKIDKNCLYLEDRIKDMDAQGIQKQVLSIIPVLFCYEVPSNDLYQVAEFINNYLSSCVDQYPDRFLALGTLPMQDTKLSLKMINSNLENKTKLNLIGYQIGSNINNVNLDNEKFFPIYELLEKNQLILFIHPWNMMGEKHIKDYWLPWLVGMPAENSRAISSMIFGGIFDKFPNLKVVFAHGGGSFCGTVSRINHGYNVRPDLCGQNCLHEPLHYCKNNKIFVDSLVHSSKDLNNIINLFGENNIIMGSDYPFPLGDDDPGKFIENSISDKNMIDKIKKFNLIKLIND